MTWWFRRAWFWRQTWGQAIVGGIAFFVTACVILGASDTEVRVLLAFYFAMKVSGYCENQVATEPPHDDGEESAS